MEEATHRLNCVLADKTSTIIQLKKTIEDLEAEIIHLRAKKIKEEPMDPASLIKESDTSELHVCTV